MWLINTSTLALEEFQADYPSYAILSHRWAQVADEVSFQDFNSGSKWNTSGYAKIVACCSHAKRSSIDWVWVDTCCIDKKSSAELSEAINSMWSYYQDAQVCYAFLSDVVAKDWERSEWWTRGWTLQELLAPKVVHFFDQHWELCGTKADLASSIGKIVAIPDVCLRDSKRIEDASVAERMSWAAGRKTTRPEDRAYSLLGLFKINMPLLYGEGAKAFRRLQLEIIQKYPDETILAWSIGDGEHVLAESPDQFEGSGPTIVMNDQKQARRMSPIRATPWGIEMRTRASQLVRKSDGMTFWSPVLTREAGDRIWVLKCILVLFHCGPAPNCYRRHELIVPWSKDVTERLEQYDIGPLKEEMLFYLQFDTDLPYVQRTKR